MLVLARIQIFREIPLKIPYFFVYERKAFACSVMFHNYAPQTELRFLPTFTMGQICENKRARVEIFRLSYFEGRILKRFENFCMESLKRDCVAISVLFPFKSL